MKNKSRSIVTKINVCNKIATTIKKLDVYSTLTFFTNYWNVQSKAEDDPQYFDLRSDQILLELYFELH